MLFTHSFLIPAYFVSLILRLFSSRVVAWGEQRVNECRLRVAKSLTQLLVPFLSDSCIIHTDSNLSAAWAFLRLHLLVSNPAGVDRHVDTGRDQWPVSFSLFFESSVGV